MKLKGVYGKHEEDDAGIGLYPHSFLREKMSLL